MRNVRALLLMLLLAHASAAGYLFLTGKILLAEKLIAAGQRQFDRERGNLEQGKIALEAGKQRSADGKKRYEKARGNAFLVLADKLFKGGKGFRGAKEQIAEGDKRVIEGENRVSAGQERLDAGEVKLLRARELVRRAKGARVVCALGAALFGSLSIVLGIRCKRSLARILKHGDTLSVFYFSVLSEYAFGMIFCPWVCA